MSHRFKVNMERKIVENKGMKKIFDPLVNKVKSSYGANKYDEMVNKLSVELNKKKVPFSMDVFERNELTVEGLCQGIWNEDDLKLFVEAGLAECRYALDIGDDLLDNTDDIMNNHENDQEYD